MNSKLTLIILSALGSLDVSVYDFVIIETCTVTDILQLVAGRLVAVVTACSN